MTRHARMMPAAIAAAMALGLGAAQGAARAAALQTVDTTSLAVTGATIAAVPPATPPARALVVQADARALRPAPVPDQDFDAPGPSRQTLAAQDQARLQPSLYSAARQGFSGDGFAPGSTLDDDHANRRRPGGGMSLSIPMQ